MKSIRPIILGCSKNRVDAEHVLSLLEGNFDIVPEEQERDYVDYELINTCSFIGDAKEESIQTILEAVERKKAGQVGQIVVFGCLPQRYPVEIPELIPEVDAYFGARDFGPVLKYFGVSGRKVRDGVGGRAGMQGRNGGAVDGNSMVADAGEVMRGRHLTTPKHYAYLKISEGCDRRCSYCAIPFIRGRHISVPIEDLVAEASELASKGVKELIVIAQDTTFYGLDIYGRRALGELLRRLSAVEGIEWIRLHYSYPADFPEDVLEEMAANPKICKYIDIPLQHISDKLLSMMHRQIDGAATRDLVWKMREKVPGLVLRTTMIVGHPGEGEAEFAELLQFVKEAKFERLGAFEYSEEEGTFDAEHFADEVEPEEKHRRLDELMKAQMEISLGCNQTRIGTECEVIVDDFVDGVFVCRSQFESPEVDGEILVKYDAAAFGGVEPYSLVGEFITVKIICADEYDLIAEVAKI